MTERIGFIGLGLMGRPMAHHLLTAGYQLTVFNRSHPAIDELVSAGAIKTIKTAMMLITISSSSNVKALARSRCFSDVKPGRTELRVDLQRQ